jgi:hypothetical protein
MMRRLAAKESAEQSFAYAAYQIPPKSAGPENPNRRENTVLPRQCISGDGDGEVSDQDKRQNYAEVLQGSNRETNKTYQTGQQMNGGKKVNPPAMSPQSLPLLKDRVFNSPAPSSVSPYCY